MPLLTQNSELKPHRIHNFAIPAWFIKLDGKVFKTCPNAGACAKVCYARNGTYLFSNVLAAHTKNLRLTLEQPELFREMINKELKHKRFNPTGEPRIMPEGVELVDNAWLQTWVRNGGAAVRIHDSGDFYSETYLDLWFTINVRQGDIGAISESLKAHGQYRPIVVDKRTNRILAGNHTWKAAKSLGWTQINCRVY
jgi:hypothetical protein